MPGDRGFTHPNFGREARVEVWGREVRLIFIAGTEDMAHDLADRIIEQMKNGSVNISMMGKPIGIVEG